VGGTRRDGRSVLVLGGWMGEGRGAFMGVLQGRLGWHCG